MQQAPEAATPPATPETAILLVSEPREVEPGTELVHLAAFLVEPYPSSALLM